MLYAFQIQPDGSLAVQHIGGLTRAEQNAMIEDGWVEYWTTTSGALAEAHRLSHVPVERIAISA